MSVVVDTLQIFDKPEGHMEELEHAEIGRPAIYARVSTEEQAQFGTSLETQIETLKSELAAQDQPQPILFVDDGYSGSTPNRPGLMELERAISEGKVSQVRISSLDRLARDLVLQETLLNRWERLGVSFRSQREPDLGQTDPTRVLIRQVLGAISQYERAVIATRMLAGRLARAHQGFWPGGKVPYGYGLDGIPPKVVLDPAAAEVMREAGRRVIAGERVTHIASDFNRLGVPGPGGNGWDGGYLSRLLQNPAYKGEAHYRMREYVEPRRRRSVKHAVARTKNSPRIRPEEDWITVEVPAVFSATEWETIQATIAKRGKPKKDSGEYLISRRFHSACGSTYAGNYNNGKPRYLCRNRTTRKYRGRDDCGCPAIPSVAVDSAAWQAVAEVLLEPERLMTAAREELNLRGAAQSEAQLQRDLQSLEKKLARAREALARLVRYHAQSDTLDSPTFETALQPLREEVATLESERERFLLTLPGGGWEQAKEAIEAVALEVMDRLDNLVFDEKQRLLALLDVQIKLEPNGQIVASLAAPRPSELDQRKVLNCTSSRSPPSTSRRSHGASV